MLSAMPCERATNLPILKSYVLRNLESNPRYTVWSRLTLSSLAHRIVNNEDNKSNNHNNDEEEQEDEYDFKI